MKNSPTPHICEPTPFCIYTVRSSGDLTADLGRGSGEFTERKRWVSAFRLLDRAKTEQQLSIVFAHGECINGVRYCAFSDELQVSTDAPMAATDWTKRPLSAALTSGGGADRANCRELGNDIPNLATETQRAIDHRVISLLIPRRMLFHEFDNAQS